MRSDRRVVERQRSLVDERDFLARSLVDLDREAAAGDVEAADYEALRSEYATRMATTLRALNVVGPALEERPADERTALQRFRRYLGRRSTRKVLGATAFISFLLAAGLFAAAVSGVRLPGEQLSGSVSIPTSAQVQEELARAAVLGSAGQLSSAISLYGAVLTAVPRQPVALCYRGWLERLSGLAAHDRSVLNAGDASLAEAVAVAPRYADATALYGVALYEDKGEVKEAVAEFTALLRDHPSVAVVAGVRATATSAFKALGEPVPSLYR